MAQCKHKRRSEEDRETMIPQVFKKMKENHMRFRCKNIKL